MAQSYNGWPASRDPHAIGVNAAWEPIRGHRFPGGIKAGDVETVMTYVIQQIDLRVEPIDRDVVKDDWGYVYKASANSPSLLSCHSSATAVDYNATRHPNGRRGTWTKAQALEIGRILAEVDNVIDWRARVEEGGVATGTADEMHFEVSQKRGSPQAVARVAARLRAGLIATESQPVPPTTFPQEDDDMVIYQVQPKAGPDGGKAYAVGGGKRRHLDSDDSAGLRAAGVPQHDIDAHGWQVVLDMTTLVTPNSGKPG